MFNYAILRLGIKNGNHPRALQAKNNEGKNIPHLPIDIITEILSRLPTKSILKFRKVCKLWRSITTTSHFIEIHSEHSLISSRQPNILAFDSSTNTITVIDSETWEIILKLRKRTREPLIFQGSCNGVVCMYNEESASIELINPMTCESITIPQPVLRYKFRYHLGFDPSTKKFKVVCHENHFTSGHAYIYTVGDSTWRRFDKIPDAYLDKEAVYLNGALHWLGTVVSRHFFYTLDLKDETMTSVDITRSKVMASSYNTQLGELEGSIWVSNYRRHRHGDDFKWSVNMFMMDGDHDKGSKWVWKYRIEQVPHEKWSQPPTPLLIVQNKKIVFCDWGMDWLMYYDIRRRLRRLHGGFKVCYDLLRGSLYLSRNNGSAGRGYCARRSFGSCIAFRESLIAPMNDAAFKPPSHQLPRFCTNSTGFYRFVFL